MMRLLSLRQTCLALLACAFSAAAAPEDGRAYDLLGRVLHPYAALFAEGGNEPRALTLALRLDASEGFSMDLTALHAEVSVEYPDKLKIHAPLFGDPYTVCRRGQMLWVYPGSRLRAALDRPEIAKRLPAPDRQFQLRPFRLPIPQKQLVFLPALFQARSAPPETVEGIPCQVLDLKATPLLGQTLDLQDWSARLWVDAQAKPVRFSVTGPATKVSGRVERADFARSLPPETWVPSKEEEGDVVLVPPARYDQLLRALMGLR